MTYQWHITVIHRLNFINLQLHTIQVFRIQYGLVNRTQINYIHHVLFLIPTWKQNSNHAFMDILPNEQTETKSLNKLQLNHTKNIYGNWLLRTIKPERIIYTKYIYYIQNTRILPLSIYMFILFRNGVLVKKWCTLKAKIETVNSFVTWVCFN